MKKPKISPLALTIASLGLCLAASASGALPAFPGAEGFGADTPGGRGGRVIEVTNLNDSGPGSFREACLATGPRTIVFRVGGTIVLNSRITLTAANSFVTIAGQTAPGGGIQTKGFDVFFSGTHDVVIRHMRFRPGETSAADWSKQGLTFYGASPTSKCYNVVVDHCSIYWGPDDNMFAWEYVENITWQWCMSEGMAHDLDPSIRFEESKAALMGAEPGNGSAFKNLTVHHCYMANSAQRNALMSGDGPNHFINNVIYNWRDFGTQIQNRGNGNALNIIGNFYKPGPVTNTNRYPIGIEGTMNPNAYVYVQDNIGPFRPSSTYDEWAIMGSGYDGSRYWTAPAPTNLRRTTPWPASTIPVTVTSSSAVVAQVLANAGATLPVRDSVDQRLVNDYYNNTGTIKMGSQQQASWWPVLANGTPPADTDHDGMPDAWEVRYGLNPNDASDGNRDNNGNGYTNLEEYLNGTVPVTGGTTPPPTPTPTPTPAPGPTPTPTTNPTPTPTTTPTTTPGVVPAFPGAQGYGAETKGGRGGRVIAVTNLNDSGPGSFREACMATGPRIIVFRVGGTINLQSRISMTAANSFATIAGQTAPGGGIQIKGWDIMLYGAHDVVIRYLRIRPGGTGASNWSKNALLLYGDSPVNKTYNIVVDHCSMYWGPSENILSWDYVENVTWQRCLSEGVVNDVAGSVYRNSFASMMGADSGSGSHQRKISVHRCYFANSAQHNPMVCADGPTDVVNNVVYNWKDLGACIQNRGSGVAINLIGNVFKRGPVSNVNRYAVGMDGTRNPDGYVYVKDNIGPFRPSSAYDDWAIVGSGYDGNYYWTVPAPAALRRLTPWTGALLPVTAMDSSLVVNNVLSDVGAMLPMRDALDQRLVQDFYSGTGTIKTLSSQLSSWWPALVSGVAPLDSDGDGMPDAWEIQYGFNPQDPSDGAKDADNDGYTNVEEYLNRTNPKSALN